MKIYNTQEQIDADIINGVLTIDGSVQFKYDVKISGAIKVKWDIDALNIDALNISATDIDAKNINANNIIFYAVAFARESFRCRSIKGKRPNSKYFCLDSDVVITGDEK